MNDKDLTRDSGCFIGQQERDEADMEHLLVGRGAEFDSLRHWSTEVEAGKTVVVLIHGEAGIGKTRLVKAMLDRLTGWSVLSASGDQAEARLPYAVLGRLGESLPRSCWRERAPFSPAEDVTIDPFTVGASLIQLLGETSRSSPIALVIDDAGWADQQSLQALAFALRRMDAAVCSPFLLSGLRTFIDFLKDSNDLPRQTRVNCCSAA